MRFESGFAKIPRVWWSHLEGKPPAWAKVWLYLAINANIKPGNVAGKTIKPGQIVISVARLAQECHVTTDQTRAALQHIQATNTGTIETTNKFSIVTLFPPDSCRGALETKPQTDSQARAHDPTQTNPKREPNYIENREERRKNRESNRGRERAAASDFSPPTLDEVKEFAHISGLTLDSAAFVNHYTATDWKTGGSRIRDWRALARKWSVQNQPTSKRMTAEEEYGW